VRSFIWLFLALVLFCVWMGGYLLYHIAGFLIHVLLVLALLSLLVHVLSGKRLV